MARENIYKAILLKKQAFGEGDEILTVFSEEAGKLRFLAKSTKFIKSKLQYSLQTLFMVKITVSAKGNLPRVIGAEVIESFAEIRENLTAAKLAIFATELMIKFTPDEQKNEHLFNLLSNFLNFLKNTTQAHALEWGLAKFKIEFLEAVGLAIHYDQNIVKEQALGFSNREGKFTTEDTMDYIAVRPETFKEFLTVQPTSFENLSNLPQEDLGQLQIILSDFLNYHLEREIKSERFL